MLFLFFPWLEVTQLNIKGIMRGIRRISIKKGRFFYSTETCSARFPPNLEHLKQSTTLKHLHFVNLTNYEDGSKIQNYIIDQHITFKLLNKNSRAISSLLYPTVLTFEFNSVYTGGKRERDSKKATKIPIIDNITTLGVPYIQTDRGGQVTYHGPGQLVAYFIWDLKLWKNLTSKCFVNFIEKCSMNTISETGVNNVFKTENTGVWIFEPETKREEKISSIGLNIKRNVTSHGLSINLKPDLKYLNNPEFVMCGLNGYNQTSIEKELGNKYPIDLNVDKLGDILCDSLKTRMNNYMMNMPNENVYKLNVEKKTINLQQYSLDNELFKSIDDFIHV